MQKSLPEFGPGDTVAVQVKVKEGNRERLQAFEDVTALPCLSQFEHGTPGNNLAPVTDEFVDDLPKVRNGLGVALISTNRGVLTDEQARSLRVGGEVLCEIW